MHILAQYWRAKGSPFQDAICFLIIFRAMYATRVANCSRIEMTPLLWLAVVIEFIGCAVFVYYLDLLYEQNCSEKRLVTTGLFRYTRHPMYTGLVMTDTLALVVHDWSLVFFVSTLTFYAAIIIAAYYQEQETIVRFGIPAIEYYHRTPRLFIFYPIIRRVEIWHCLKGVGTKWFWYCFYCVWEGHRWHTWPWALATGKPVTNFEMTCEWCVCSKKTTTAKLCPQCFGIMRTCHNNQLTDTHHCDNCGFTSL